MASATEIANLALQHLGADPVLDITDNNERARTINRAYEPTRRAELRRFAWGFSIKREILAPDTATPAFGPGYQFTMPSDCLRPLPPKEARDWSVEGGRILTDDGDTLELRYISDVTDANTMDDLFREAFAARLAMRCCEKITGSTTKAQQAEQAYKEAISDARRMSSFEQVAQEPPEDDWLMARY